MRATDTLKKLLGPTQDFEAASPDVTIRYARPDDALALMDLADLDSSRAPHGIVLVAEVGGRLWAAHSLDDGHAVADPFRPSRDECPHHAGDDCNSADKVDRVAQFLAGRRFLARSRFAKQP